MKNLNVIISDKHDEMIHQKIELGEYDMPSEVIRDALELLREQDILVQIRAGKSPKEILSE